MTIWRIRSSDPAEPPEAISANGLARRIGATSVRPGGSRDRPAGADEQPAGALASTPVPTEPRVFRLAPARRVRREVVPVSDSSGAVPASPTGHSRSHAHPMARTSTSWALLWRDTSVVLFGIVVIALVAQMAGGGASPSAVNPSLLDPSTGAPRARVGLPGEPFASSGSTIGLVVDPSLVQELETTPDQARSSSAPRVTLPPTLVATPRPIATPSVNPTAVSTPASTPSPTPPPTPTDSPAPAPTPGPTPTPTPTPAPTPTDSPAPTPT